jgi:hypothetical protein
MVYVKTQCRTRVVDPCASWGEFERHLEIGDDLYAVRHVDVFANGYALRYDRVHWVDDFGVLADAPYDRDKWMEWWGRPPIEISSQEFEDTWTVAGESPATRMQAARAWMPEAGSAPPWLSARPV